MGERIKAEFTMIGSHTAGANASEWQIGIADELCGIIDHAVAERCFPHQALLYLFILRKNIQGKRTWLTIDVADYIINIFKFQDRENRTENFLLHNRIIPGNITDDSWF